MRPMNRLVTGLAAMVAFAALAGTASLAERRGPAAGPVQFAGHDIDADFRGGYAVAVADFNKDGRLDVVANSLEVPQLAWYENPVAGGGAGASAGAVAWPRHLIVPAVQSIVNLAMEDIDGDGTPEIAIQSDFAMQAAKSAGHNWIARSQGDPRQPWKAEKIDSFPTSHRVVWADLDGDGRRELINAPLVGERSVAPAYDQDKASVLWYDTKSWTRHRIADDISGIVHGLKRVNWDTDSREEILVASFEGIALYKASGTGSAMTFQKTLLSAGHTNDKPPRLGASDAGLGTQDGRKFFASIEPWHGNEVVAYSDVAGQWQRRVLFDKLSAGHGIVVVDLNDDGRSDIVANDNGRITAQRPNATPGIHVFYAPDDPVNGEWKYQRIEDQVAMNGCVEGDFNRDKRMDLVCTGAGGKVRWYENLGK